MGDLLFKFTGRIGRLGYLLALICMGIAAALIFVFQQLLGDWLFGGIIVTAGFMLPLTIYLAATSKRFQDRGWHPLIGFILFFILPIVLVLVAQQALGLPLNDPKLLQSEANAFLAASDFTPLNLAKFGLPVVAALFLIYGQFDLLTRAGSKGENVFDENEKLSVEI